MVACFAMATPVFANTAYTHMGGGMSGADMRSVPVYVAPTMTQPVHVEVKRPQILRLSRPATSVIVGDPNVADVAVHSTNTLLILGRSYGTTNIIALDASGRVIIDTDINVSEHRSAQTLRVHGGDTNRMSYRCAPDCLPSPSLGDDRAFIARFRPGAPGINNDVATGALTGPQGDFPSGQFSNDTPSVGGFAPSTTTGAFPPGFDGPPPGFEGDFDRPDS